MAENENVENEAPQETPPEGLDSDELLAQNRKKNKENQHLRDQLRAVEAERDEIKASQMSEQEKAVEAARQEGYTAAVAEFSPKLAEERVRVAAVNKFADPDDAILYLNPDEVDTGDKAALEAALDAILQEKPHLAAATSKKVASIDQGPQGSPTPSTASDWVRTISGRR